jgi:arabinofuranosyltransferase
VSEAILRREPREGSWLSAVVVLVGIVLAISILRAWRFTVDDTFITLRYSRNVAEGLGPTFNATGPRAEGYTSLLWMLVLVAPHRLGLDALVVAKALGIAATFSTLLIAARWARTEALAAWGDRRAAAWAGATAAFCFGVVPATALHAVSGMETALFTLLLTAMFAKAAGIVRGDRGGANGLVALALLTGLTRPEGNLAALVVIGATVALLERGPRVTLVVRAAAGWIVPVCAYELWRRGYYGLLFPLPFYVKLMTPGFLAGWPDVRNYLGGPVLHLALLIVPALVRPARTLWPALAAMAAFLAFFLLPQHLMGFEHRYLAPLDPSFGVLAGIGLARLFAFASRDEGRMSRLPDALKNAIALVLVGSGVGLEVWDTHAQIGGWVAYGDNLARAHERLGADLFALDMPEGRLAISDAGAVPYLSRWWTLDMIGLNDASIATTGRRDPASVLAYRPDVVVLVSRQRDRFESAEWSRWESPLFDACVATGFVSVGVPRHFADNYWLWVMARADSKAARGLSNP